MANKDCVSHEHCKERQHTIRNSITLISNRLEEIEKSYVKSALFKIVLAIGVTVIGSLFAISLANLKAAIEIKTILKYSNIEFPNKHSILGD